jgi:hypothetical protein
MVERREASPGHAWLPRGAAEQHGDTMVSWNPCSSKSLKGRIEMQLIIVPKSGEHVAEHDGPNVSH